MAALESINLLISKFEYNHDDDQQSMQAIDLSIFNLAVNEQDISKACQDCESCICIKRILQLLQYFQSLDIKSNENDQNTFVDFIHKIYTSSDLIMDHFHLQKKHGQQVFDIMAIAKSKYKLPACDIQTCAHSSRLYRVDDAFANIDVFDEEDEESVFKVVLGIIDGIHHFIFHVFECGLRDIPEAKDNEHNKIDDGKEKDEFYDMEYARMSARISSTRNKTRKFDRINKSGKFNIGVENTNTKSAHTSFNETIDVGNYIQVRQKYHPANPQSSSDVEDTYLDSIYIRLDKAGVDKETIARLQNYASSEMFDSETMDIDIQIETGGNIETNIKDNKCISCIKNIFNKASSFVLMYIYVYLCYFSCVFIRFIQCLVILSVWV